MTAWEKGIKAGQADFPRLWRSDVEEVVRAFLAEQPTVEWCQEHRAEGVPSLGRRSDHCWKGRWVKHLSIADCRMTPTVARLVVEP